MINWWIMTKRFIQGHTNSGILQASSGEEGVFLEVAHLSEITLDVSVAVALGDTPDTGTQSAITQRAESNRFNSDGFVLPQGLATKALINNPSSTTPTRTTDPTSHWHSAGRQDLLSSISTKINNSSNKDCVSVLKLIDWIASTFENSIRVVAIKATLLWWWKLCSCSNGNNSCNTFSKCNNHKCINSRSPCKINLQKWITLTRIET